MLKLSNVERIEATGASAVVGSIRRVKAAGGTVRICNANPRVAWNLKLVGADRLTMGNLVTHGTVCRGLRDPEAEIVGSPTRFAQG
jgi:anti-anti-sigma regulatory factor